MGRVDNCRRAASTRREAGGLGGFLLRGYKRVRGRLMTRLYLLHHFESHKETPKEGTERAVVVDFGGGWSVRGP